MTSAIYRRRDAFWRGHTQIPSAVDLVSYKYQSKLALHPAQDRMMRGQRIEQGKRLPVVIHARSTIAWNNKRALTESTLVLTIW